MIVVKFVKSVWSVGLWIFPVSKRKTIHGETFSMKILVCMRFTIISSGSKYRRSRYMCGNIAK